MPVQPKDGGSEQLYVTGLALTFNGRNEKVFFTDTSQGLDASHIEKIQKQGYLVMGPFGEWWTVDSRDHTKIKKIPSPLQKK